jgi:hypothetical protein
LFVVTSENNAKLAALEMAAGYQLLAAGRFSVKNFTAGCYVFPAAGSLQPVALKNSRNSKLKTIL